LISNDRNLVQGCCPLKLLEAMASGTPVIASDLPVVRCIATGGREAMLVRPGSAKAIKEGLVYLRDNPCFARQLSLNARSRVENHFTWTLAGQKLRQAYRTIS
jgi:glycosyltransferase involved in cell wall biosynthesis